MNGEKVFSLATAMLGIAMVAVIVQSPNTSKVFKAAGDVWVGSVKAVMGNVGR